jgi:hypothetical protein
MLNKEKINQFFKLPIEHIKHSKIKNTIKKDLELIESKNLPIYDKVFSPKTTLGKYTIENYSKFFTNNKSFLKDSQKIHKKNNILIKKQIVNDMVNTWNNIKNEKNFEIKYQYIEFDKLKFINHNSIFLTISSLYNLTSPVINLAMPVIICIIPYFLLLAMGKPITFENYKILLWKAMKQLPQTQIFSKFNSADFNQKLYYLFLIGLYFWNVYQNILTCYNFYKNTYHISNEFQNIKNYIDYTVTNMNTYLNDSKKLKTYKNFRTKIIHYKDRLIHFRNAIDFIPTNPITFYGIRNIGYIMKYFYAIYDTLEIEEVFYYSFGFNGYIECIHGLKNNLLTKKINNAKLTNKDICTFKNLYHPSIKTGIIKNDLNLNKSKIITGPNASGKTTLLKASIINIILTQQVGCGYYDYCKINPFDFIHCYINIPDTSGRDSLFQAEVRRCKNILNMIQKHPNRRHFCVFDELYSGTNPYEAISSAYSYLKFIIENSNIKLILTTHFIKLCNLLNKNKDIENFHMKTNLTLTKNKQNYSYKFLKGISKIKGGLSVLRDLKYPQKIINSAQQILVTL